MVVTLLNEQIVIALHKHPLSMHNSGLQHLLQKLVVELGPLVNEPQLGEVAMLHAVVQHPLDQEDDDEPVDGDDPQ